MTLRDSMGPARRRERANSFGPAAHLYDRSRPTYPPEAVTWAFSSLDHGATVADIGAGTGIMTRVLTGLGYQVTAVEPDPLMRERLAATTPGVAVVEGSAERLPLADASVDGAIAAQAYHWFDQTLAHPELARVIRPGGVFAAIWNERDDGVAWVQAYSAIVERERAPGGKGADAQRHIDFGDLFAPVEVRHVPHEVEHTPQDLALLAQSRSYFITASPQHQADILAEVDLLCRTHPDLAGREQIFLPYVTRVVRAIRR